MDPCLPVDPPSLYGRLPAPCPVGPVAYVTVAFEVLACWYPNYGKWWVLQVASRWTPPGVPLRPYGACGVASWCWHVFVSVLSRQPRSRCWSRMLLTIKCRGPFWLPRLDPTLRSSPKMRTTGTGVASTSPQLVVGYATFCADPQTSRTSLARSIATTGPVVASALTRKWKGGQLPTLDVKEDVLPG